MFKFVSALLLSAAMVVPAHAAVTITLSPNDSTAPSSATQPVIQSFDTLAPDGSPFLPNTTNTVGTESVTPGTGPVVTSNVPFFDGLTEDYLEIGRLATYTISFAQPVSFFSFAFNITNTVNPSITTIEQGDTVTLTFSDLTTQVLTNFGILGSPSTVPLFGRVTYDTGTGAQITSVAFQSRGNNDPLRIDAIAAAAPEPAAWLMMILGFGLVGSQLRRRKGTVKLAAA